MNTRTVYLVLGWLLALAAYAQPPNRQTPRTSRPPDVLLNCDSPQSQVEINLCAQMRFQKADEEMNALYRQLIALLTKDEKGIVVQAQRQWVSYRDAHCRMYEKMYEGGSALPMALSSCREETTLSRIKELKALLAEKKLR